MQYALLDLNGTQQTIASLAGGGAAGGNVSLGSGTLTVNGALSTSYAGVISGTGGLVKQGAGTLILAGANTYTGATTVSTGTLQLGNGTTNGSVAGNITDNSRLVFNNGSSQTYGGVVGGSGTVTKIGAGALALSGANSYGGLTTVTAGTLELGESAQSPVLSGGGCDIQGGQIVFDYTGTGDDPASTIKSLLTTSYDASGPHRFDVGQFKSTTADATHGLGWIDNTTTHQVTVGYTLYGDANLDGRVNVSDLAVLAANYRKSVNGWANGDFNYDGVVDVKDLALLAANYRQSLAPAISLESCPLDNEATGITLAAEPCTLTLLACALAGLLAYAWRKRK